MIKINMFWDSTNPIDNIETDQEERTQDIAFLFNTKSAEPRKYWLCKEYVIF